MLRRFRKRANDARRLRARAVAAAYDLAAQARRDARASRSRSAARARPRRAICRTEYISGKTIRSTGAQRGGRRRRARAPSRRAQEEDEAAHTSRRRVAGIGAVTVC